MGVSACSPCKFSLTVSGSICKGYPLAYTPREMASNSVHFGRKNPLGGSRYVDICCEALVEAMEHPTDFFLERTIRLAQIGEGISEAYGAPNDPEQRGAKSYLDYLETSSGRFRRELDRVMESVGDEQQLYHRGHPPTTLAARRSLEVRRAYLTLHYQYLDVRLHEPATHLRAAIRGQTSGGNNSNNALGSSELRSLRLRNCLAAVTAYLDTLLAQPPESILTQPLSFAEQATFVIVVATRLVLDEADAPDWDVEKVRRTFDLSGTIGRLAEMLDAAEGARRRGVGEFAVEMGLGDVDGEEDEGGRAAVMARDMRGIQDWLEAKLRRGGKSDEEVRADGDPDGHDEGRDRHGIPEEWIHKAAYMDKAERDDMAMGSAWVAGLLGNMAWNFDDMDV